MSLQFSLFLFFTILHLRSLKHPSFSPPQPHAITSTLSVPLLTYSVDQKENYQNSSHTSRITSSIFSLLTPPPSCHLFLLHLLSTFYYFVSGTVHLPLLMSPFHIKTINLLRIFTTYGICLLNICLFN